MAFDSPTFLFLFLPVTLALFHALARPARTAFLVAASFAFYAWSEQGFALMLAASSILNWLLALAIEKSDAPARRRAIVGAAVILNVGALVYFKYSEFLVTNLNGILDAADRPAWVVTPVHLPIGISFVTFEAVSYVVDVYRRNMPAARNPLHVACFLSFFPHLIAGPILRFRSIAGALASPSPTVENFDSGITRFITGLAKKMLLANPVGRVADAMFALAPDQLGAGAAWLGIVCFSLQIYFDFSGYSDMAIGLGRMLGFSLPENFRLPYAADSVREFWRRWHISLSTWFRDYLFLPLGGSRRGTLRTAVNLLAVFLLCGIWHGANWTFVVWGAFHGTFLVLERVGLGRRLEAAPWWLRRTYTVLVILVSWVFFRARSMTEAGHYLTAMAGGGAAGGARAIDYMTLEVQLALVVGILLATVPWSEWTKRRGLRRLPIADRSRRLLATVAEMVLFLASLLSVAANTSQPFIYFRF